MSLQLAKEAYARFNAGTDHDGFNESIRQITAAVDAVALPKGSASKLVALRPTDLTAAQRDLLGQIARAGFGVWPYQVPRYPFTLLRWLGLEPQGLLETLEVDGEPLYRALQLAPDRMTAIVDALPIATILRVLEEIYTYGGGYSFTNDHALHPTSLRLFRDLRDEGKAWAVALADTLTADPARQGGGVLDELVFLALVRAGVPLEERWQALFPSHMYASHELVLECARALPPAWRAVPLARLLKWYRRGEEIITAFPDAAVAKAWLDAFPTGSTGRIFRIGALRERFADRAEIAELVRVEAELNKPPPVFPVVRRMAITDAAQLTPLERDQLRFAGRGYDEQDLDAEARLADDGGEQSFRGHLELRTIANEAREPWLDAVLYLADYGVLFLTGTVEEFAWVAQGGVQLKAPDEPTRQGLQQAISNKPVMKKPKKPAKKRKTT